MKKRFISIILILSMLIPTLTISIVSAASDATNAKGAELIDLNEEIKGSVSSDDGDFYKIKIEESGKLTLFLEFDEGCHPFIELLEYTNKEFEVIAEADCLRGLMGYGEDPISTAPLRLPIGTYYINVDVFTSQKGNYYLTAIFESEDGYDNFEIESNNTYKTANILSINTPLTGNINDSSDTDWFKFTVEKSYNAEIEFSLDSRSNQYWDIVIYKVSKDDLKEIESMQMKSYSQPKDNNLTGRVYIRSDKLFLNNEEEYAIKIYAPNAFYHSNKDYMIAIIPEEGDFGSPDITDSDSNITETTFGSKTSIWAKKEVEDAYDGGLVPETLVGKDLTQKINRSEFAAVAVLIYENLTNKSVSASSTPFTDIKYDENQKAINKAYKLGITVGTSSTTFDPLRNITREELATMLCRGIKKYKFPDWTPETDYMYYIQGTSGKKFADDAEISDYAKNSVYFMSSAGIVKGVDSTHFAPKASVTRGDAIDYGMATREQAIIMAGRIKENKSYFDDI